MKFTLLLTIALVIGVIFVFLRNVSATVIPSLAVPLSLLGTFAAMKLLGFTIDMLSMMAMTLSVGFVVDDAIVMLENIVRHMEMGKPRMQAALEGAREVGFTIVSMTISLVAVFIPVLFLGGIIGRLLREFSITIAVAVLISGVISLTLTPMLCSRFLHHESHPTNAFYRWSEKFFDWLNDFYRRTLLVVMRHRRITLAAQRSFDLRGSLSVRRRCPKVSCRAWTRDSPSAEMKPRKTSPSMKWCVCKRRSSMYLAKNHWVEFYGSGVGAFAGQNQGFAFVSLKHDPHRPKVNQIIGQLQMEFAKIPG